MRPAESRISSAWTVLLLAVLATSCVSPTAGDQEQLAKPLDECDQIASFTITHVSGGKSTPEAALSEFLAETPHGGPPMPPGDYQIAEADDNRIRWSLRSQTDQEIGRLRAEQIDDGWVVSGGEICADNGTDRDVEG